MNRAQKAEQQEAIERLREILKPGDTIYTVLRHVSSSGMSRRLDLYKLDGGEPVWLTGYAKRALGMSRGKHDAMTIGGCGTDVGFEAVYNLSRELWPDGHDCIGERCPSNDHSNGDRNYEPHHHNDSGYALRQRWM